MLCLWDSSEGSLSTKLRRYPPEDWPIVDIVLCRDGSHRLPSLRQQRPIAKRRSERSAPMKSTGAGPRQVCVHIGPDTNEGVVAQQ
jgi:hypothetical protein